MFKNCAKWVSAAALAWTVGTAPAAAATYVKPNHGYDLNPVPAYRNAVPVAKPLWSASIGLPPEPYDQVGHRLAVGGKHVFYLKEGKLIAAAVRTGAVAWTYGQNLLPPLVYHEGDIAVFGTDGKLRNIDAAAGAVKWTADLSADAQEPAYGVPQIVFDGETIFVGYAGHLLALDRETGKQKWTNGSGFYSGGMIVADELLLVHTFESGAITVGVTYAVNKQTGETLWRTAGSLSDPLLVEDGRMYAENTWPANDGTTHQFRLSVVDLATGETIEERQYIPVPEGVDPLTHQAYASATDGESLFIQAADQTVYQYDYRIQGDAQQPKVYSSRGRWIAGPYNNKLFFAGEDGRGIEAVKLIDRNRIYYEGLDNPVSRLDFYDTGMFVGQTDGEIYALDVTTGKALFRFQTNARDFDPFQIVDGVLLASAEGTVYAFELPKQLLQPLTAAPVPGVDYVKADADLVIDGKPQTLTPAPVMIGNRMYVPLRAVFEAVGATVDYDAAAGGVIVEYRDRSFTVPQGENINNTVYIPIRDVGALLGINVEWDAAARTVIINTSTP